jgi:hypothetical protein
MSMSAPLATLYITQKARAMIDGRSEFHARGRGIGPTLKRRTGCIYVRGLVACPMRSANGSWPICEDAVSGGYVSAQNVKRAKIDVFNERSPLDGDVTDPLR